VQVRPARGPAEVAEALRLREQVFSVEQGVRSEADRDGRDPEATHVVALHGDALIGTCRLVFDGPVARLGRMAVEPGWRGRGVGAALLGEAERCAREAGARRIDLHAQTPAISLYARSGFAERGEPFFEEGIQHVSMDKPLA
jgi:predicted GNAT family N-acyltransferase